MKAAFDNSYVKNIDADNTIGTLDKRAMLELDPRGHQPLPRGEAGRPRRDAVGGEHRDLHRARPAAHGHRVVRGGDRRQRPDDRPVDALRLRGDPRRTCRSPTAHRTSPSTRPCCASSPRERNVPISGKDFKTGQTLIKTVLAPMLQGPHARPRRLVLDQHPRQPRRRGARRSRQLQDQGGVEARRARGHPRARPVPRAVRQRLPQGAHQLLPAAWRQQGGLGQHRHLRVARLPDADQGRLPVPRLDPRRAARARPRAVQRPRASAPASAASRSG